MTDDRWQMTGGSCLLSEDALFDFYLLTFDFVK
jgi:hypothetical protein